MQPRRYGQWAGNDRGREEDKTRCVEEITPSGEWIGRQCNRKRGHGKDELYCKQHAKNPRKEMS